MLSLPLESFDLLQSLRVNVLYLLLLLGLPLVDTLLACAPGGLGALRHMGVPGPRGRHTVRGRPTGDRRGPESPQTSLGSWPVLRGVLTCSPMVYVGKKAWRKT